MSKRKFEKDLIQKLMETFDATKEDAKDFLHSIENDIKESVKAGDTVQWTGLAVFESKITPARVGRNPKTGEPIQIPEKKKLVIRKSDAFQDFINE